MDEVVEASTRIESGFACIFWLSDDYSEVTGTDGEVEFLGSDILQGRTVDPKGVHDGYRLNPHLYNRGRVTLIDGRVVLSVGKGCSDDALRSVQRQLGLSRYSVEVERTGMYDRSL